MPEKEPKLSDYFTPEFMSVHTNGLFHTHADFFEACGTTIVGALNANEEESVRINLKIMELSDFNSFEEMRRTAMETGIGKVDLDWEGIKKLL